MKKSIDLKENRGLIITLGSFIGIGLLLWIFGQSMSFLKAGENYDAQTTSILVTVRQEMFNSDMLRYMALILMSSLAVLIYLKEKLKFGALTFLIVAISLIDLINIQGRVEKQFVNKDALERNYFKITSTDQLLFKDKDLFRVLPLDNLFTDNRWSYHHQSVGGYSPIKMFTIEEFITNNIKNGAMANRNVMKILNVKYVISGRTLSGSDLTPVHQNKQQNLITYLYNDHKRRGFFVGSYKKIEDEFARLREINSSEFNPDSVAILEEDLQSEIFYPDSSNVTITSFNPNLIHFDVYTDTQVLFVISELYYPPGWRILLDGQEVEKIYKTDHAVQSIVVPAGAHKIEVNFEPESYSNNIQYAMGSLGLIYLIIISSLVKQFLDARKADPEE